MSRLNPEQFALVKLHGELRQLKQFGAELENLAGENKHAAVLAWGTAGWSVREIDRQIIAAERELERLRSASCFWVRLGYKFPMILYQYSVSRFTRS